jgi:hypothetical protein
VSPFPRTELLLALACAGAAGILAASEFMFMFEFTPPGGEAFETSADEASERHNYAMLVLALFALVSLVAAVTTGSQIASFAVAAAGVVALLIFLIGDLPDVNKIGALEDPEFVDAKAEPQQGFWLALTGSLLLAVCGGAMATLSPQQLKLIGREEAGRPIPSATEAQPGSGGAEPQAAHTSETGTERRRARSRIWPTRSR